MRNLRLAPFWHHHVFEFVFARELAIVSPHMGNVAMNVYECRCGEQRTEWIP